MPLAGQSASAANYVTAECIQIHGGVGYTGPCPPIGRHRYFFKLYAVDRILPIKAGASKKQLLSALEGHALEEAELMGTYGRS